VSLEAQVRFASQFEIKAQTKYDKHQTERDASHVPAPKARNIIARGKREARRPWIVQQETRRALKRAE